MAWLVTHMWMALVAAAVFALLLGWTLRGILVTRKLRKAVVEKDIALTELDQARDEIERLFAAQRAQKGEGGAVADVSERKISDLTAELQKAKTELATLKSPAAKASSPAAPAPASPNEGHTPTIVLPPSRAGSDNATSEPAVAEAPAEAATQPPAGGETEDAPTLVWRNRHLESRVKRLEEQLAKAIASLAAATPAALAEAAETVPTVDEEGVAKLKWQADYLKQRVEALEAELAAAPAEAAAPVEDVSEEMARLRWRNRFLEGRLAYFGGGSEEAAAEPAAQMTGAEAMLEQLEVADTAADMTEAVEAMAEEVSVAGLATDAVAEAEEAFADVPDDEEESLAEADHADQDVLTDEEYSEEDFTAADTEDDMADEADAEEFDDEEDFGEEEIVEEAEDDFEVDDDESDEFEDEADEFEDEADEDSFDDEEDDLDDGEVYDEADDEDEYLEESDEDDDSFEDDDEAYDEVDEAEDEAEETDEDEPAGIEDDADDEDVAYEPGEEMVAERPMAMDGPVEGHPDDLTMIGGIGPKIQVLLNELGIWHYDQIAAWSPENVAWVDEHLNFNGRIVREGWVGQAAVLVADEENV